MTAFPGSIEILVSVDSESTELAHSVSSDVRMAADDCRMTKSRHNALPVNVWTADNFYDAIGMLKSYAWNIFVCELYCAAPERDVQYTIEHMLKPHVPKPSPESADWLELQMLYEWTHNEAGPNGLYLMRTERYEKRLGLLPGAGNADIVLVGDGERVPTCVQGLLTAWNDPKLSLAHPNEVYAYVAHAISRHCS